MGNGIFSNRTNWRVARATIVACAFFTVPLVAQDAANDELQRRATNVEQAQKLLLEGDVAYGASKYEDAVTKFSQAFALLPDAPITKDLRDAAADRYATAAAQRAQELSNKGDVAAARALCEQVLADDVAPKHAGALAMRDKLFDPIRTNPALTKEHTKDVDEVRRTLYEADGFFQLGKFDEAAKIYNDVLRIDPYNKAARRGMEKVAAYKTDAHRAAQDHTRAEMLQQVDAAWEMPVPEIVDPLIADPLGADKTQTPRFMSEKMATMIVPLVDMEQATLLEAIDFIRSQARVLDVETLDDASKGINFVINLGNDPQGPGAKVAQRKFDLKVQNIPMDQLLQMICDQCGAQYTAGDYAVTIRPLGTDVTEIVTRTYKVPPDFLSGDSKAGENANADPFGGGGEDEGLLAKKMTAEEKLKSMGVPFPDGTSASYNPGSSTLMVKNTTDAHGLVQNLVDMAAQTEPVQVVINVKIIKIQNVELEELGFDWMFNELNTGNGLFFGGGTQGTGDPLDFTNGSLYPAPVTSGLRSGDTAIVPNSIDELIRNGTSGFSPSPQRAAGFLSVLGNNLSGSQVAMVMRGFSQKKGVDIMVQPSTVARSGQTSKIEVIREFIHPTEYEPPELPNTTGGSQPVDLATGDVLGQDIPLTPITPATPTAFEARNVGVTLEVNPVVSNDRKTIELALKPELVSFDGFVNYGTPINGGSSSSIDIPGLFTSASSSFGELTPNRILMPIFSITRADTSVSLYDGATIVIGGMIEEKVQNVEDKVPVLGSLPLFGRAFQSKALQPVRTSVLIMVTAELQDPAGNLYRDR